MLARSGEAEIAYEVEGSGADVLLVHSGATDRRSWRPVIEALAGGARTIAPDLRGFGDTRYPPGGFEPWRDLLAVLDAAGSERAVVVGNSFGGWVAMTLAARAPERVAALVLLAPLAEWDFGAESEAFAAAEDEALERGDLDAAVRLNVDTWAPDLGEGLRAQVAEQQRRAFELQRSAATDAREIDDLPARVRAPARILVGDRDLEDFQAIARMLSAELAAPLDVVAGAGHLLPLGRPELVAAAIREALP